MPELLIKPFQYPRASHELRDEIHGARDQGSSENAVQDIREVDAAMRGREEGDGRDGVDDVFEHRVVLAL